MLHIIQHIQRPCPNGFLCFLYFCFKKCDGSARNCTKKQCVPYAKSRAVVPLYKVLDIEESLCSASERGDLIKTDKFSWVQQDTALIILQFF